MTITGIVPGLLVMTGPGLHTMPLIVLIGATGAAILTGTS